MGRVALLLLAAILLLPGARRQRLVDPIPFAEFTRYEPAPGPDILGAQPIRVLAGDTVPADGWLIPAGGYSRLAEGYDDASRALGACYDARELDRWLAAESMAGTIAGLKTCRAEGVRSFFVGTAVGYGVCSGVERIGDAVVIRQ